MSLTGMEIAQTILAQLGGARFPLITGATNLVAWDDGLSFKLPQTLTRSRINWCRICLTPADLYTVEFYAGPFAKRKKVAEFSDVYCDQLQDLFEEATGLSLSLCRVTFG